MTHNDTKNLVILDGRLAEDPKVTTTGSGKLVANLKIATNKTWKDKETGEKKSSALFHDVTAWDKLAEYVQKKLKKGTAVEVWGELVSNEKTTGKDSKDYYNTYVLAKTLKGKQGLDK